MEARDLISDIVPTLRTSDTGVQALSLMDIYKINHMPIVNNNEFLGLISENDIIDMNIPDEAIGNHQLSLTKPYVNASQHFYEVVELAANLKLTAIPVLDVDKSYLGLITLQDLLHHTADMYALKQPGGIITVDVNNHDYSLVEIAQIVEMNDVKILSLYVSAGRVAGQLCLTLKVNTQDLTSVLKTFERYNYSVSGWFAETDDMEDFYKDRYDSFMKYMNV